MVGAQRQRSNNTTSLFLSSLKKLKGEVSREYSVKTIGVFGSVARDEQTGKSDIDLLVDALPGATVFDLGGLQVELEDLLGCRVDLVTPEDLPVAFRARILAQAKPL